LRVRVLDALPVDVARAPHLCRGASCYARAEVLRLAATEAGAGRQVEGTGKAATALEDEAAAAGGETVPVRRVGTAMVLVAVRARRVAERELVLVEAARPHQRPYPAGAPALSSRAPNLSSRPSCTKETECRRLVISLPPLSGRAHDSWKAEASLSRIALTSRTNGLIRDMSPAAHSIRRRRMRHGQRLRASSRSSPAPSRCWSGTGSRSARAAWRGATDCGCACGRKCLLSARGPRRSHRTRRTRTLTRSHATPSERGRRRRRTRSPSARSAT
jgi:hypothetical protein